MYVDTVDLLCNRIPLDSLPYHISDTHIYIHGLSSHFVLLV